MLARNRAFSLSRNINKTYPQQTRQSLESPYMFARLNNFNNIISRSMSSGPIYTVNYLSSKLQKELQAEHVDIEDLSNCGCGMKFDAVIVSPQFEGKPILQRQRLVNQTLAEEMKHIHAFTMRTLTPSQWKENQSKKEQ